MQVPESSFVGTGQSRIRVLRADAGSSKLGSKLGLPMKPAMRSPPFSTMRAGHDAVHAGCGSAVIMDGRVPHCAIEFLFGHTPIGTAVTERT